MHPSGDRRPFHWIPRGLLAAIVLGVVVMVGLLIAGLSIAASARAARTREGYLIVQRIQVFEKTSGRLPLTLDEVIAVEADPKVREVLRAREWQYFPSGTGRSYQLATQVGSMLSPCTRYYDSSDDVWRNERSD